MILGGSAALGAYEPGVSDVDVIVVCAGSVPEEAARALAASVSHRALPCPARRLELVVVSQEGRALELNLNTGADASDHVGLDPAAEPAHWFVIDRSIARARGRSLFGPPPSQVLGDVPRAEVLAALRASLDWYGEHEPVSPDAVLNACRAWRWARTGHWTAKAAAGEWARGRMADPSVVESALAARAVGGKLEPDRVAELLDAVRSVLAATRA